MGGAVNIGIDKILQEILDCNEKWCRLRRKRGLAARPLFLAERLSELKSTGDAMRHLNSKGRITWKASPRLRDYVNDLRRDAEADLESEIE